LTVSNLLSSRFGTFTGKYKRPRPFGGIGKPVDEDGFSDHFPIGMQAAEAT